MFLISPMEMNGSIDSLSFAIDENDQSKKLKNGKANRQQEAKNAKKASFLFYEKKTKAKIEKREDES